MEMPKGKPKTKNVVLDVETDERLVNLSDMDDTRDGVVRKLLGEKWHIEKLKDAVVDATQKLEDAKKDTRRTGLAIEAADIAITALRAFVEAVEAR